MAGPRILRPIYTPLLVFIIMWMAPPISRSTAFRTSAHLPLLQARRRAFGWMTHFGMPSTTSMWRRTSPLCAEQLQRRHVRRRIPSPNAAVGLLALVSIAAAGEGSALLLSSSSQDGSHRGVAYASCAPASSDAADNTTRRTTFSPHILQYDHYGGVTLNLGEDEAGPDAPQLGTEEGAEATNGASEEDDFASVLAASLEQWEREGKKGIWIHVPAKQADKVHAAISQGFEFHMVVSKRLVLTRWLDGSTPSRLPPGPTHQVGVGCLVLHPDDPERMLVVQEKSGPAAAFGLWKMPTGLADPGEDIHDAAVRELQEETGLTGTFVGILTFRQAHAATGKGGAVSRANSDLFFVCRVQLTHYDDNSPFEFCPTEIAAVKWMPVKDYCAQERWQGSSVYMEMNRAILEASRHALFHARTLPLGFAGGTNTLYNSQPSDRGP